MIEPEDIASEARACGDLWVAVLLTAIADAHGKSTAPVGHADACRAEARQWFERGGRDFEDVCALAGADPEMVRRVALAPTLPETFNHRLSSLFRAEHVPVVSEPTPMRAEPRPAAAVIAPVIRRPALPRKPRTETAERKAERNRRNYLERKARHTPEEWQRITRERNERCRNREAGH